MLKLKSFYISCLLLTGCSSLGNISSDNSDFLKSGQIYQGVYTCQQGTTMLNYAIQSVKGNNFTAVYNFNYAGTHKGSFLMKGSVNGYNISAAPVKWLNKPKNLSNWYMVSLMGRYDPASQQISGRIPESGCSNFIIELQ